MGRNMVFQKVDLGGYDSTLKSLKFRDQIKVQQTFLFNAEGNEVDQVLD